MLVHTALLAASLAFGGPPPRGNTALDPSRRVWSVQVSGRMGILIGGGDVLFTRRPPLGYGFGLQIKYHALRAGPLRFGLEFHGGHTRFPRPNNYPVEPMPGDPIDPNTGAPQVATVRRISMLSHTDLTLGPSVQVIAGPLLIDVGVGGGLMVSNWRRLRSWKPTEDEQTVSYDGMVRAGASIGVPIRNNHGIALGVDWQKAFSNTKAVTDLYAPMGTPPDAVVFDMLMNVNLAYQAWF
jgi:hypothetical protein